MHQHPLPSPQRGLRCGKQAHKICAACVRDLSETLQLESPKGMSPLHRCKVPFHPFPPGSHLAGGFFPESCCPVPGPWFGSTGGECFTRLCSSLPGHPSASGKGGSSSEQPRADCVLTGLWSGNLGHGPTWTAGTRSPTSSDRVLFCSLAVPGGESPGHCSSAGHNELEPGKPQLGIS